MCFREFRFIMAIVCLMFTIGVISACSTGLFTYKGDRVTRKDRMILLAKGDQQGVWKTNELAITYQYQMTPEALNFAGTTELLGGFALGFNWINQLAVYLLFLDDQGTVIDSPLLYSAGIHRPIDTIPMDFERTLPVPEGAWAISFAYEGELIGTGTEDSTSYSIWYAPSRP